MASPNPYTSKVFDKLAQLKQWQCEQHERLIREQEEQRRLLNEEQTKRMQNLGLENIGEAQAVTNVVLEENFGLHGVHAFSTTDSENDEEPLQQEQTTSMLSTSKEETLSRISDSEYENKTRPKMLFIELNNEQEPTEKPKRKFTFLKRGEGLSRFRLTPHDIALQNKRIQAAKGKPGSKKAGNNIKTDKVNNVKTDKGAVKKNVTVKARSSTAKSGDVKTVNQGRIKRGVPVVTAEGKMMIPRLPSLPTLQLDVKKPVPPKIIQTQSHSSNGTTRPSWNSNVTDLPPIFGPPVPKLSRSTHVTSKPQVLAASTAASDPKPSVAEWVGHTAHFIPAMPLPPGGYMPPSWSSMLTQAQMTSINTTTDSTKKVEQKELRMFEKLERIAADSSFCSSSSVVTKFVEGGYLSSSVQSTPQVTPSKQQHGDLNLPDTSTPFSSQTMENARALLEKLAAFRFSEQPVNSEEKDEIMLDLRPLQANERIVEQKQTNKEEVQPTGQHVRFQEQPEIREVEIESEAWSESGEEDTSLETDTESETTQQADSSSEEAQPSEHENEEAEKLVIGSLVHTRLEQLQQELLNVQTQQAALTAQRAELSKERQRLADAVTQTEDERRKLEGERKNLGVTTRKRQNQDREKIDQLQKQLTELQCAWSEREARWSAAQASQRAQLRQISLENKELALQINQLKAAQTKKVQFAPIQKTQPTRPAKRNDKPANETNLNRRKTLAVFRSASPEHEPNHYRTNSASPSVPLRSYETGPSEARSYETRPSEARSYETRPSEARSYETRSSEARSYETRPSEARPYETRPSEARPYETRPSEARPYETEPSEARPYETRPSEARPYETRPSEARPYENRPSETGPSEARPYETGPSEARPYETEPSEARPFETGPSEARPYETRPSEARPYETRPSEARPYETEPSEARPFETGPSEARPYETRPSEARSYETRPSEARPYETGPSEARPYETRPSEARSYETRPSEARPYETGPSEARPYETRTSEAMPHETRRSEARSRETRTSEARPHETRISEARSYENRSSVVRPYETRPSEVSRDNAEAANTLPENIQISNLDDIDAVIAKYKDLCNINPSPSCSLVLNTPRGIKKAYNTIFHGSSIITDESIIEQTSQYYVESVQRVITNPMYSTQNSRNPGQNSNFNRVPVQNTEHNRLPIQSSGHNRVPIQSSEHNRPPIQNSHQSRVPFQNLDYNRVPIQNSDQSRVPIQNSDYNRIPIQNSGSTQNYNSRPTVEQFQNSPYERVQVQNSATNTEYSTQNKIPTQTYPNNSSRPNVGPIQNSEQSRGPNQNSAPNPGYLRQNSAPNTTSGMNSEYPVQNSRQMNTRTSTPQSDYPIQNTRQQGNTAFNWDHAHNPRPNRDPMPNSESQFVHPTVEVDMSGDLTDYHEYEGSVLLEENNRGVGDSSFLNAVRQEEQQQSSSDSCKEVTHEDGSQELWFPSGNCLKISPDGKTRTIIFYNGDIQETLALEGLVRYYYAESNAWQETLADGTQIVTYPNGQKETTFPSGRREVRFPDDSVLEEFEDGRRETRDINGARLMVNADGTSVLYLPNGCKEYRTKEKTTLEYPNGTVRIKYPSGLLETKYPDGRVRVKDSTGKLIMDTHCPVPAA